MAISKSRWFISVFFFSPWKNQKYPWKKKKGVREKTEVPVKILVNSTRETNILARENCAREKSKVCVKKLHWSRKIILLYSISYGLPNNILSLGWESWEKIQNWGKNEISPRETRFLPVKKNQTSAREKKRGREKNGKKCAWKHRPAREKTQKCQKK